MKKIFILLLLSIIATMITSCGFETTKQHESRVEKEAESIKEMQENNESVSETVSIESESTINSTTGSQNTTSSANSDNQNSSVSTNPTTSNYNIYTEPTTTAPTTTAPSTITVYLTVKCNKVIGNTNLDTNATIPSNGIMLTGENGQGQPIVVPAGSTVYDVMTYAARLNYLNFTTGSTIGYLSSINGLYEQSCGSNSGWKYMVNGYIAGVGTNIKTVKNGNAIVWFYALEVTDTDN